MVFRPVFQHLSTHGSGNPTGNRHFNTVQHFVLPAGATATQRRQHAARALKVNDLVRTPAGTIGQVKEINLATGLCQVKNRRNKWVAYGADTLTKTSS